MQALLAEVKRFRTSALLPPTWPRRRAPTQRAWSLAGGAQRMPAGGVTLECIALDRVRPFPISFSLSKIALF